MSYVVSGLIFFALSSVATGAMYYFYTSKSWRQFPVLTHVVILLSILVCVLPFPLLILDVDAAVSAVEAGASESSAPWFRYVWSVVFWATQVMAWVILPVAQEYDSAGDFTVVARIKRSIRENLKMYIVMGILAIAGLGYIIFLKGLHSFLEVESLCFSIANAFGLLLICVFLASGLVGVPALLWRMSDPEAILHRTYYKASDIQEDLDVAAVDLAEIKAQLIAIDPFVSDEHRPLLGQMLDVIDQADKDIPQYHLAALRVRPPAPVTGERKDLTLSTLVGLNTKLKRAVKIARRMNYLWEAAVKTCRDNDNLLSPQRQTKYYNKLYRPVLRGVALLAWALTILILWSELVLPFQVANFSIVEVVMSSPIHFVGSSVVLFYMATCSYWASFQFKVLEVYHLIPAISDATSLCFTATFLTRLLMPLCYNFLWMGRMTGRTSLVWYSRVFGDVSIANILGPWLNRFVPVLIPVMAMLMVLNVFDRMLLMIGMDRHDPTDVTSPAVEQRIREGRKLIMTAVGHELRGGPSSSPTPSSATPPPTVAGEHPVSQRYEEYKAKRAAMMREAGKEMSIV